MNNRFNTFYVVDFETTQGPGAQVALGAFRCSNSKDVFITLNVEDFLEKLTNHALGLRNRNKGVKKTRVFFHNGSGFDLFFITAFFKYHSKHFRQKPFREKKDQQYEVQSYYHRHNIQSRRKKVSPQAGDYEMFINGSKKILNLQLWISKNQLLDFRCSYILFLKPLKDMGKDLEKMNYPNSLKGNYKYSDIVSYQTLKNVPNQLIVYLKQDINILMNWLLEVFKIKELSVRTLRLTAAAMAYADWSQKALLPLIKWHNKNNEYKISTSTYKYTTKYEPNIVKTTTVYRYKKVVIKAGHAFNIASNSIFKMYKYTPELLQDLRKWYTGGLTHYNPIHFAKVLKGVRGYDVVSMYPDIMNSNRLLPYGTPFIGDGGYGYPLKLWKVTIIYKYFTRKSNNLPILPWTDKDGVKFYSDKVHDPKLYLTGEEWNYVQQVYDKSNVIYKAKIVYSFKAFYAKWIFKDYVDYWFKIKQNPESNPLLNKISKLMLNGVYGKFGTDNHIRGAIFNPTLKWNEEENQTTYYEELKTINEGKFYLPIAIWITAYARLKLALACENQYDKVAYLDTDSIYVLPGYNVNNLKMGKKLGEWGQDHQNVVMIIGGKKRYVLFSKKVGDNQKWLKDVLNNTPEFAALASYKYRPKENKQHQDFKMINMLTGFKFKNTNQAILTKHGKWISTIDKVLQPVWYRKYAKNPDIPSKLLTKQHFINLLKDQ